MGIIQLLEVEAESGMDLLSLQKTAPPNITLKLVEKKQLFDEMIKDELPAVGINALWRKTQLGEEFLSKKVSNVALVRIIANMLARFPPCSQFVVVDAYFFLDKRHKRLPANYADLVADSLKPILSTCQELVLITKPNYSRSAKSLVISHLHSLAPWMKVTHHKSEDCHDRYWIADQKKGLFVGTSLNGLGLRYSIVDYLDSGDLVEIVQALKNESLL